jgi:hypothetical protein
MRRAAPAQWHVPRGSQSVSHMLAKSAVAAVLAAVVTASSCGGDDNADSGGRGLRASSAPGLTAVCRDLANTSRARILCPRWLPSPLARHGGLSAIGVQRAVPQPCSYFIEALAKGHVRAEAQDPFHFIIGGRCKRFSLAVTGDRRWPVRPNKQDYLALVGERSLRPGETSAPLELPIVIGRETIAKEPGLLCRVTPYPDGGLHGGHYALIWNEGNDGYVISFHYPRGDRRRPPTFREVRDLRRAALSMTEVTRSSS